jgi:hypothetical protein
MRLVYIVFILNLSNAFALLDYIDYVNTFIDTSYFKNATNNHDYGNTDLQVGMPLAHSPWTPSTQANENKCVSPYYYFNDKWIGMRKTHWMSGSCVIDYGSVTILPSLTLDINEAIMFHKLDHNNEVSTPSVSYTNVVAFMKSILAFKPPSVFFSSIIVQM